MFQQTTALKKILTLKKRIRAVSGGTGASKTISILCWLIDYCQSTKGELVTVVAESVPHLKLGAIRDFKNIMVANRYWNDNLWNETHHFYALNRFLLSQSTERKPWRQSRLADFRYRNTKTAYQLLQYRASHLSRKP